jgi:hypothetical protein
MPFATIKFWTLAFALSVNERSEAVSTRPSLRVADADRVAVDPLLGGEAAAINTVGASQSQSAA